MGEDDDTVDLAAAAALVVRPPHCEHCDVTADEIIERHRARVPPCQGCAVLIEMQPGPDGKPWYLCAGCWVPGRVDRPVGEQSPPPVTQPRAVKVTKPKVSKKRAAARG